MSNVNGQQILKGLAETRRFFEQVALLIRTAEGFLKDKGWEPFGNKCTNVSGTLTLDKPKEWLPREVYRFFVASEDDETHKDLVIFVGVLMDTESDWSGFKEPWITCGLYQLTLTKDVSDVIKGNEKWWVRGCLEYKHDPDGTFQHSQYTPEEQEEWGVVYEAIMALPLVTIENSEGLQRKIIEPLLQEVDKVKKGERR